MTSNKHICVRVLHKHNSHILQITSHPIVNHSGATASVLQSSELIYRQSLEQLIENDIISLRIIEARRPCKDCKIFVLERYPTTFL